VNGATLSGATADGALSWWPAPAKLNLFLHVVGRMSDGYHCLQTVFQLIDRCDRIGIAVRPDGLIERPYGMDGLPPQADLAVRAAQALQRHTGVGLGATLHVIKQIPAGGGLGGGSSDAATVLVALNALWRTGLDVDALAQLGLSLGADVPVFVRGRNAWGEGRGERLAPLELPGRWFLVLQPRVAVRTAEIFQAPELTRNSELISLPAFLAGATRNDCEPVVRARYPEVAAALEWLGSQADLRGASVTARLTGTGSCLFAAFEHEGDAQQVATRVPERWQGFVARGLQHSPLHGMLAARL
jgi:4-diphosphocytidyl-2-C-methyl-D-erythritol kinase